jgi:hypothetical protein
MGYYLLLRIPAPGRENPLPANCPWLMYRLRGNKGMNHKGAGSRIFREGGKKQEKGEKWAEGRRKKKQLHIATSAAIAHCKMQISKCKLTEE